MSEEAVYVFKEVDDNVEEADILVKNALSLETILYTQKLDSSLLSYYINLLETIKYLKFEIRDPEYDAQAQKHKTVFYYIVSLNKENKLSKKIKEFSDKFKKSIDKKQDKMPQVIEYIRTLYRKKIDNEFTTFEEIYRDYKNKNRKKEMLDYTSAKKYFFQDNFSLKLKDMKDYLDESLDKNEDFLKKMLFTPYELFLDTLAVYLIGLIENIPSFFKKLKNKKKSICKLSHKVKSKVKSKGKSKVKSKGKSKIVKQIKSKFGPSDDEKHEDKKVSDPISGASYMEDLGKELKKNIYFSGKKLEKNIDFLGKFMEGPSELQELKELHEKFIFYKTKKQEQKLSLNEYNWNLSDLQTAKFIKEFENFIYEVNRHSLEYKSKIIKIIFNLIFNKYSILKDNDEKSEEFIIFQDFLNQLNIVIPNFDKIMIKDRDKNPFFLMYFLYKQDIYVELHCNGKVYNFPLKEKPSNPYKIHVGECYITPLILETFGIVEDSLTITMTTPGGGSNLATPGGGSNLATPGGGISLAASSDTGPSAASASAASASAASASAASASAASASAASASAASASALRMGEEELTERNLGGFIVGGLPIKNLEEKDFSQCSKTLNQSDKDKLSPLDAVLYHQCKRFYELDLILSQFPQTIVVIAGNSKTGHSLGKGFAVKSWGGESNQEYKKMQDNLSKYINYLVTKHNKNGKARIIFGNVGQMSKNKKDGEKGSEFNVTRNPEASYINVWGADVNNWNLKRYKKINGGGQASSFETQIPGVFGIGTMKPKTEDAKEKVLEKSNYTTILPGSDGQLATPSPVVKEKGGQTPVIHQQASSSRLLPESQQTSSLESKLSDDEWATSDEDESSSDDAKSSSDEDESGYKSELDEKSESSSDPKKYYVYFGSLSDKNANKSYSIDIGIGIDKQNYFDYVPTKDELKTYIKSKLKEKKILIRFYYEGTLTKFIYLTTEKNEKLPESMLVKSAEKDPILQSVFELVESKFKSKKKSLAKKPVSKKKSLVKKSVSKKKSLVKKSVSKKKSLAKKSVSKKKSLAKKSVFKKKSLAKKPVKSLYKKKKF